MGVYTREVLNQIPPEKRPAVLENLSLLVEAIFSLLAEAGLTAARAAADPAHFFVTRILSDAAGTPTGFLS